MEGKYIYGIIKTDYAPTFNIPGVGGVNQVFAVEHQGLSCVLSDYSGAVFSSMSNEELFRCILAQQVVVERLMQEHTVLPVKFGTVLATSEDVQELLSQGYQQLIDALAGIQDKVELEVAATWDKSQVFREIGAQGEIARAREALAGRPGGPTLEERVLLGKMVKAAMDQRRDNYREQMISCLKPVVVEMRPNALLSDQMVMNVAFLLERARLEEFDSHVRQLNSLFRDQIDFRILGPLPPYSFATVEVARVSLDKIEQARGLLGLREAFSEAEVRRAYRHLAAGTHPDRKPGDEMAKALFIKLRQAADLLLAYCRAQARARGSFLINIGGLRSDELQLYPFAETGR